MPTASRRARLLESASQGVARGRRCRADSLYTPRAAQRSRRLCPHPPKKRLRTGQPTEQTVDTSRVGGRLLNAIMFGSLQSERFIPKNVLGVEDSSRNVLGLALRISRQTVASVVYQKLL